MTDTMVSTREVPWMKLGKLADKPMTAAEAADLGGLNWTVEKRPVFVGDAVDATTGTIKSPDKVAVTKVEKGKPDFLLGYMSPTYPILQNVEGFDFMDTVNPTYVAAGSLKKGRQPFMVVKAPETITVLDGEDPHELFIIMRNSHDGSRAVELTAMPLRDRCMNQLALRSFVKGATHRWSIKHTPTMFDKLKEAQTSLSKLGAYAKAFEDTAHKLTKVKVDDDGATQILKSVLKDRPKREQQIERIITSWHQAPTIGFDYTGWGLLNAVSEDMDWGRSGGSPESRFIGALQGQTHNMLNRVAGRLLSRV